MVIRNSHTPLHVLKQVFETEQWVGQTANVFRDGTMHQLRITEHDVVYYNNYGIFVERLGADEVLRDFRIVETENYTDSTVTVL